MVGLRGLAPVPCLTLILSQLCKGNPLCLFSHKLLTFFLIGRLLLTPYLFIPPALRYGYLKKLIEEANTAEDTRRLLQFCCWENPQFSHAVLYELLWQIAFAYTYELRPYLDLLLHMLCMEDSWQNHRLDYSCKNA